jgi:hydrogenase nickel incorporation protein HypB
MCDICGCGQPGKPVIIRKPGEPEDTEEHEHTFSHSHVHSHGDEVHEHVHNHTYLHQHNNNTTDHDHNHGHNHTSDQHNHSHGTEITVEQDILNKNNLIAERNRGYFEAKNIFTLNLVSSPGSGKTSLIEKTIKDMGKEIRFFIIEGDQQTMNDAKRIEAVGAPVVQVNTGEGCHLDSNMINRAMKKLEIIDNAYLIIENVGNLICPALFDLGESKRVVIMSVTEGEDKPLKYPNMFQSSDICIMNKTDLLPYVDFDMTKAREYALRINHHLQIFELSVKTGEGLKNWYNWLKNQKLG